MPSDNNKMPAQALGLDDKSGRDIAQTLNEEGITQKKWIGKKGQELGGKTWTDKAINGVLHNIKYIGKISHQPRGATEATIYDGQHEPIIEERTFKEAQQKLKANARRVGATSSRGKVALLKGTVYCKNCGELMTPSHSNSRHSKSKKFNYYICQRAVKQGYNLCDLKALPMGEIDRVVTTYLLHILESPALSNLVVTEITNHENGFDTKDALKMIGDIRGLWKQMMPRERNAIVKQVFDKINIAPEQITLCINTHNITGLDGQIKEIASRFKERDLKDEFNDTGCALFVKVEQIEIDPEVVDGVIKVKIQVMLNKHNGKRRVLAQGYFDDRPALTQLQEEVVLGVTWLEELLSGKYQSVSHLAKDWNEKLWRVKRILKLGTLSPEIVTKIMNGELDGKLNLTALSKDFPANWQTQKDKLAV